VDFFIGALAVVFCVAMALKGHLVAMVIGGVVGSFFGLAGFGGAVSGMIPGAVAGAIVAVALKSKK
jgi:hypothetical protein